LLAEDSLPDALIVREALRQEGLELDVNIAADGERAMAFLHESERDPDAPCPSAMLLDLNLPKMDGFEILRAIRASRKFKDIPVLVVTSSDSPEDRARLTELGASYFQKPVTYTKFIRIGSVIKAFLEENHLL
jgi:DNA-binding response OmpR family regulator